MPASKYAGLQTQLGPSRGQWCEVCLYLIVKVGLVTFSGAALHTLQRQ